MCSSFLTTADFFHCAKQKYIPRSTQVRGGHACRVLISFCGCRPALGYKQAQDTEISSQVRPMRQDCKPARLLLLICFKDSREMSMDAIVWLVRAVRNGRWLPGYPPAVKRRMVLSWESECVEEGGGDMTPVLCSVLLSRAESQILFSSSLGPLGRPLTSVGPSG